LAFIITTAYEPFDYLIGAETEDAYLGRMRAFTRPYDKIETETPPDSVILMLGEVRAWNLDRRAHWAGNLDGPRVAAWLAQARSKGKGYQVAERRPQGLSTLANELVLRVSKETNEIVQGTLRQFASLRYSDENFLIYELLSS
jgi:hypothetical protein